MASALCAVERPWNKYRVLRYFYRLNNGSHQSTPFVDCVQGLRDCCRSIRIGKILVESDLDTHEARVVYAKFPHDIADRKVLLMYPIMSKRLLFIIFSLATVKTAFIRLCSVSRYG